MWIRNLVTLAGIAALVSGAAALGVQDRAFEEAVGQGCPPGRFR